MVKSYDNKNTKLFVQSFTQSKNLLLNKMIIVCYA